jgi:hypothetical protein
LAVSVNSQKLLKVNSHPLGENSPNLVTLLVGNFENYFHLNTLKNYVVLCVTAEIVEMAQNIFSQS